MTEEKLSKKELKAAAKQARQAEIERQMQEKKLEKSRKLLERYGLENLTDPEDIRSIANILGGLAGFNTGVLEWGSLFSGKYEDAQYYMQKGIFEQNMIMIRQLDRITQLLKKIADEQ